MPLRQYFAWVGSILLVALFVADWCFPASVHAPRSEIPPHERVNLRIIRITNGRKKWCSTPRVRHRHPSQTPVSSATSCPGAGDRAADRAFHGLEGFFPHPLAGEAGSPLNIVG
jgi:hypothetical protein